MMTSSVKQKILLILIVMVVYFSVDVLFRSASFAVQATARKAIEESLELMQRHGRVKTLWLVGERGNFHWSIINGENLRTGCFSLTYLVRREADLGFVNIVVRSQGESNLWKPEGIVEGFWTENTSSCRH